MKAMLQHFLESKKQWVTLNEVQQQAVSHTQGPMLLLASPGSGKTTTMIMRLGYLISCCNVQSNRLIAVSFSRASAADMEERYRRFFPELPQVKFSTIHSLAFEIVRTALKQKGLAYRVIDGFDEQEAEKTDEDIQEDFGRSERRVMSKHHLLTELFQQINSSPPKEEQMDELKRYISYIKNKMLPQEQWSSVSTSVRNAAQIMISYEARKRSNDMELLLDFDDMLVYAQQFLCEDSQLRSFYKARFHYVLSDESQDTSMIQHKIISWLVEDHQNLCVVADDDQSIYSWRGAEPSYLLQFQGHYPQATILFMEQNYRSAKNIVDIANGFIKRNHHRYPKSMFTTKKSSVPIVVHEHANALQETAAIAEAITQHKELHEVAVLYRNHSSSLLLMHELNRRGISFYMKDADDRFFKHWILEDILNVMRLSYTDRKFDLFQKAIVKLNVYISKQQILELQRMHANESLFQLMLDRLPLKTYQQQKIVELKEGISELKSMPPREAIAFIRNKLGYEGRIHDIADKFGFQKENLLNVLNNLEAIADGLDSLEQFAGRLKELEALQHGARRKKRSSAVTLSTLHSAKGLEFDIVYMIDLVQGVIPSRQDMAHQEMMEEAARLFYVGMTRARYQLELHSVRSWQGAAAQPSLFVQAVQQLMHPPVPAAASRSGAAISLQSTSDEQLVADEEKWLLTGKRILQGNELTKGMQIEHKQFGIGVIYEITSNKLSIDFQQHGKKALVLTLVLARGLLKQCEAQAMID